jgi:hypothetical protein
MAEGLPLAGNGPVNYGCLGIRDLIGTALR